MINTNWKDLEKYLLIDRKLDKSNIGTYKSHFKYISEFFNDKEFIRDNINVFLGNLRSSGRSNSTLNNYIKTLKHLNRFLKINEMNEYSYFDKCYKPQRLLTDEEVDIIINTLIPQGIGRKPTSLESENYKYSTLMYFFSVTGMRNNEVCTLKWENVTPETITVTAEIAKSGKERIIPINKETYQKLLKLKRYSNGYVFGSERGKLDKGTINCVLKLKAKLGNIKDYKELHIHLFRHYFATSKLKNHPIDRVSKILGHSDVGITASIYGHYDMSMLRTVIETDEKTEMPKVNINNTEINDIRITALEQKLDKVLKIIESINNNMDQRHYKRERSKYFHVLRNC